jgi:eukaryotic-like serine/threonine-protein kinase
LGLDARLVGKRDGHIDFNGFEDMARDILDIGGYTIKKRIGVGARTTIYLATDDANGTEVALKRVILERPEDVRVFEQVEAEYKIARKVNHPYIRKCYRLKKIRSMLMTKEMLLAMEYFDGQSLEEGPALSLLDVMLVFRMVATGLNAMHQCGLVHCDIKPNNILLSKAGAIKIIDLGQSCRIGTTKRRIQGTPDYIAPEQVHRKPLGPKTDIFNLGATMYWALTGRTVPTLIPKKDPFGLAMPQEPIRPPNEVRPQIPAGISKLVMDCVEEDPAKRPTDMMTVISRLDLMIHSILSGKSKTNSQ